MIVSDQTTRDATQAGSQIGDVPVTLDADAGSAGIVRTKHITFDGPDRSLELEGGAELWPVRIAYETYGTLSEERDNAIMVFHALSGDAHAAGRHSANDKRAGWWDMLIGPGKALDTEQYFVVCANVIGGCNGSTGPSSVDPSTGRPYGTGFPMITIADMVNAQLLLLDHLGIQKLLAAVGGSMGGMQVLELAISHPDRCPPGHPHGHRGAAAHPGDRLQRGRTPGDHGRPELARRRVLRGQSPRQGPRRRAHGRPHHLPLGRGDAARSSAAACATSTTTRSPSRPTSRSRATCAIRGWPSPTASTPTPTSTSRARSTTSTWRGVTAVSPTPSMR